MRGAYGHLYYHEIGKGGAHSPLLTALRVSPYPGSALGVSVPLERQAAHVAWALAAADVRSDLALLRSVHEIVSRVFSVPRPDQLSPSRAADRRMNLARLHQFETWAKEELGETQLQLDGTLAGCAPPARPSPAAATPPGYDEHRCCVLVEWGHHP